MTHSIAYILTPAFAAGVAATALAPQTLWPALLLLPIAADDVWTAAIALGLPAGGRFAETFDGNGKRWIEVSYAYGKEYFEPRLS